MRIRPVELDNTVTLDVESVLSQTERWLTEVVEDVLPYCSSHWNQVEDGAVLDWCVVTQYRLWQFYLRTSQRSLILGNGGKQCSEERVLNVKDCQMS